MSALEEDNFELPGSRDPISQEFVAEYAASLLGTAMEFPEGTEAHIAAKHRAETVADLLQAWRERNAPKGG